MGTTIARTPPKDQAYTTFAQEKKMKTIAIVVVACLALFAQATVAQEDSLTVAAPSPSFAYSGEAVGTFVGDITVKTTPTGVPSILATVVPSPLITVAPFKQAATVVAL